ncbi:hypothetical protein Tco_0215007 [Tanacetum coccineum]
MGILSGRSIGARCSPKPAPIPVEDLIGATLGGTHESEESKEVKEDKKVPKIIIEAKNQEKVAIEGISRVHLVHQGRFPVYLFSCILFILSRVGSLSPNTFVPSILLLVVIIVTVVVRVVVVIASGVPSIIKLSFIPPPKDTETPIESPIPISPSSSVGSSSPVRTTTPPPDYPFDESIFTELDNSLWIIPRPMGSEPVPVESNELDACLNVHF